MAYGDLTTTDYSKELQQSLTGQKGQPGVYGTGLGFSQADVKALQAAGITGADLASMQLIGEPTTTTSGAYQSGGGGGVTSTTGYTPQQMQNAALVRAMLKLGGGQQQQQAAPQSYSTSDILKADPWAGTSALGAAALGQNLMVNMKPTLGVDPKSGGQQLTGSIVSSDVPTVGNTWASVAQAAGLGPNDVTEFQRAGKTPDDIAKQFNIPSSGLQVPGNQPGIFKAAPMPQATTGNRPIVAAPQATAAAYNPQPTPFAQAPAAPGVNIAATPSITPTMGPGGAPVAPPAPSVPAPLIAAHTSALANAGQAMYAHFGGDPATATPADIAGFHAQLQNHMTGGEPPKKMATGGFVPGRGNQDTVPALLTPGEYVIPKEQAAQLLGRQPVRMQSGGFVQDDQENLPKEVQRRRLTTTDSSQPAKQGSAPPAAPGESSLEKPRAGQDQVTAAIQALQQARGGGGAPGANFLNTQYDPDPDPGVAQRTVNPQGLTNTQVGASAIGGLASGLASAAKTYADSFKDWQIQPSAIPEETFKQQPIQFQQYA
jgi:hypothetical protein